MPMSSSVGRTCRPRRSNRRSFRPELIDSAWRLPVATTFRTEVKWQSNGSRCGPASVANAFRSLGEQETTEAEVLQGTGKCWTGICFMGLTLDELADVARTK